MEKKTPKKKPREKPHYVNNKQFSQSVVDYVMSVNEAREKMQDEPKITEYIGSCFLKIAEGLSHKPNFVGYTYREEMVMDAVENCIKAIMNYDVKKATRTGLPNAFAYFTQITYFAFLRRIAKEKKQQDIKEKYMDFAGAEAFMDIGDHPDPSGIVDRVRFKSQKIRERDNKIKEYGKELKQRNKRSKKKVVGGLEKFLKHFEKNETPIEDFPKK
jgi:DNA-binding transcriptional regulator GbsR (MarR family)